MGIFARYSARFWGIASLFAFSLFYLLFQGGKLAFMIFIIVAALCLYLALSRWSGISKTQGGRTLLNAEHEAVVEAGTSLAVQIQVQIPGFWPIPYVSIKDRLVRRGGEEHLFETLLIPDWKRRGEVSYRTPPLRRGYYHFGDTDCSTEDIFGLFQHKGRLELPYSFGVLPQKVHIREWKQLHQLFRGVHHHSATTRSHRETTQINGVREFIYGDRLSRIHWNATAKTGTWKSKEFERESLPKTVIVLDRNMRAYRSKEHFELAVSIAASLLDYAASRDLAVGLLSVGKNSKYFEPKLSASHQKVIVNHLIDVEPDGTYPLIDVLKDRARLFTPGIFFTVVTPQFGDTLAPSLAWIEQRQMNPCHMWIAADVTAAEQDRWKRHLQTTGVMGYAVSSLDELALALGGRK
ncbi:DUF58 domain-containing protein [Paenibacillus flagellatus]|uniref:DUF58 domain-containing protein n=1 Tax=Paenibacillus flagellatus TaxID=2211139 RepID=A0A2V5KSB9_9BACL|nr:DUF58 domain-containing protein [Paenibacillus flagellatus]PYI51906.1 DUF58 domain-containing protein [Paenibacillus flagellatus]